MSRSTRDADARPGRLDELLVIDRLAIGPVQLAPNELSAVYSVRRGDETSETRLAYRYEEPVFDPGDPADVNLASMIAAQVALNYGLFCREIAFHGPFDHADRRFLVRYAAHTAREIFVKKFLEPNAFLTGRAAELPVIRRDTYLQSEILFDGAPVEAAGHGASWAVAEGRDAVLSSGGKDSLASYGLLNELGREVHPIFINESGRHWFTALNAYRHFDETISGTARVWTSSDRVFNFMLRQLPFVRSDFANVRSDEYPIRLWTVAVFLFGALPLLRKRGIGRLVIGDEHDSTIRANHQGITHYDGLYDQSRWFDEAMTRYFKGKRWGVSQFSLLRPLSELLVLRILADRYPELQRHQTSCHATHVDGDTVRPCGRCEKCRRVIGMLLAIGADPTRCGYLDEQLEPALAALVDRGVMQEPREVEHLLHLLAARNLIEPGDRARAHAEVEQLRFQKERSPFDTVPNDIRADLHRIFLEHADGAVERHGREWSPIDALSDSVLQAPYPFSPNAPSRSSSGSPPAPRDPVGASTVLLGELSWSSAAERLRQVDIALLPVGALEQHGPHLPLDTDAFDAADLAHEVAEACSYPRPLVLPLIPYGVSYHHEDFPGTLSLTPETLVRMVHEIGLGAVRNGINKLVIINGHGGNIPALQFAVQLIHRDTGIFVCVDTGETSDVDVAELAETHNDAHAGEIETSVALATRPGLVRMHLAEPAVPAFSSRFLDFDSARGVLWHAQTAKISKSGVMGDPTRATAEKGERMREVAIRHLVEFVEDLKSMTMDEIHRLGY